MMKIIAFPFKVLKTIILSVVFFFVNTYFTIHYTIKYIASGEHNNARLMFGLIYVFIGASFCMCRMLFFFIMFIVVTMELYLSIKAAFSL